MRLSSSLLRSVVGLAALCSIVACDDSNGAAGGAGNANAGSAGAGKPAGGSSSSAGKGGSSAGSGMNREDGGDAANNGGTAGNSSSGGSGGVIAHGGAPNVDYGHPEVPPAEWTNITGMFAGMESECGNMSGIFSNPLLDMLVLGVARHGLWSSDDGGASFAQLGTSGDPILNRLSSVIWDPGSSKVFYVAGIYGWESPFTDGVFKTTDGGASFAGYKQLSAIQSHNDSISVDFNDPDRKTLLSGGHEQTDFLFRSTDAGATWANIGDSLPDNLGFSSWALVLNAQRMLVACAAGYSNKPGAILRSSDGGDSWTQVSDKGAVNQPLWAYDGSIYWNNDAGGLLKSDDQGESFRSVASNTSNRVPPIQLPDGRVVTVANRVLTVSADGGKSWQTIGAAMPFDPTGLAYSPFQRAFYVTQFDCNTPVPTDAIERYGYDFEK